MSRTAASTKIVGTQTWCSGYNQCQHSSGRDFVPFPMHTLLHNYPRPHGIFTCIWWTGHWLCLRQKTGFWWGIMWVELSYQILLPLSLKALLVTVLLLFYLQIQESSSSKPSDHMEKKQHQCVTTRLQPSPNLCKVDRSHSTQPGWD